MVISTRRPWDITTAESPTLNGLILDSADGLKLI